MTELKLIEAVKDGDQKAIETLLAAGEDIHQQDEQGWTPLNYASGTGDTSAVKLLLDHGADITRTGRDNRTPLMIAKAAGREEVVAILTEAEKEKGVWVDPRETQPFCKAYYLKDLRRFPGWSETENVASGNGDEADEDDPSPLSEESVVFVHQDFTVTRSMWHGEDVVFDGVTPEWKAFCEKELELFAALDDML